MTGATCLPHYPHFTCIQPLNRKRCRYLDTYLCTHYTVVNRYRGALNIFVKQFLQFAQSRWKWKPGRRTGDCSWSTDYRTVGIRIIIIMLRMAAGSGERRGRIKQWIIMELTYGIWAAAAPWVQLGSVAHTVTPRTRPAPHQPLPSD